jgi:hypothetical protein
MDTPDPLVDHMCHCSTNGGQTAALLPLVAAAAAASCGAAHGEERCHQHQHQRHQWLVLDLLLNLPRYCHCCCCCFCCFCCLCHANQMQQHTVQQMYCCHHNETGHIRSRALAAGLLRLVPATERRQCSWPSGRPQWHRCCYQYLHHCCQHCCCQSCWHLRVHLEAGCVVFSVRYNTCVI